MLIKGILLILFMATYHFASPVIYIYECYACSIKNSLFNTASCERKVCCHRNKDDCSLLQADPKGGWSVKCRDLITLTLVINRKCGVMSGFAGGNECKRHGKIVASNHALLGIHVNSRVCCMHCRWLHCTMKISLCIFFWPVVKIKQNKNTNLRCFD